MFARVVKDVNDSFNAVCIKLLAKAFEGWH